MDHNGPLSGIGNGQAAARSLSVFSAGFGANASTPVGTGLASTVPTASSVPPASSVNTFGGEYPDGFSGSLALQNVASLTEEAAGGVLSRLNHLARWVQAQQARVLSRMRDIYENESLFLSGLPDSEMAFSLAAEEAATILGVPSGTGKALMNAAGGLCTANTATLDRLEAGDISYGHAETVLDQCVGIAPADVPSFEAKLLEVASGQTKAQFRVRAQRLRENHYPETIVERQRTAFDQRRVWLRPEPDGMSWLSAILPAEAALGIYHQLTTAARGEQAAGDSRTVDQLRTDILTDLLGGRSQSNDGAAGKGRSGAGASTKADTTESADAGGGSCRISHGPRARAEILVIINAETLFGADDRPAELLGYGPISPETARRMARKAARWTPAERDPGSEEVLRIGRSRRPSAGLKRFLRARDGTCRFPGCRANAVISEIDHTKPWAQGGTTDHDNLEHLCRRHHLFKTQGFWKAHQPSPGIIEWTSPGGRRYRTEPHLTLRQGMEAQGLEAQGLEAQGSERQGMETQGSEGQGTAGQGMQNQRGSAHASDMEYQMNSSGETAPKRLDTAPDSHAGGLDDYGDNPPPF